MKHPICDSYHLMIDTRAINPIFNTYGGYFYLYDPFNPSFMYTFGYHVAISYTPSNRYFLTINTDFTLKDEWTVLMRALKETNCYQRWIAKNIVPPHPKRDRFSTGNFIILEAAQLCGRNSQMATTHAIYEQISHIIFKHYCNSKPIDYYWQALLTPSPKP